MRIFRNLRQDSGDMIILMVHFQELTQRLNITKIFSGCFFRKDDRLRSDEGSFGIAFEQMKTENIKHTGIDDVAFLLIKHLVAFPYDISITQPV